ncbi:MAG: twin-arginine translocase subunit TatC [Nonomuraea sp.]|nr:twin-arginine translocase subunit TatC [Nonomuraea sp.]
MALLKGKKGIDPADDDGRMPLMEHLRELRKRLVISVLALVVGTVVGWLVFDYVWAILKAPYCALPASRELNGHCALTYGGVFQSFFLTLKVSFMVGLVVASPVWLYQIWAFVAPALYRNERRYTFAFIALAFPLFAGGAVLAYLFMGTSLAVLVGFAPADAVATIQIDDYLDYVLVMLLIFGVSFELPLFMVFLNIIGVLPRSAVAKHRRMAIFLMFVFAAVITPSGDPFTMSALALPMVILFLAAELVMYLRERRQPESEFAGLSDDEASPLSMDVDPADNQASTLPEDSDRDR